MFPQWNLVFSERNPFYSDIGSDPEKTWSNFYVFKSMQPKVFRSGVWLDSVEQASSQVVSAGTWPTETQSLTLIERWRKCVNDLTSPSFLECPADSASQQSQDILFPVRAGYVEEVLPEIAEQIGLPARSGAVYRLCRNPRLIVSLTAIQSRLNTLGAVLRSIVEQSRQADRIILAVSSSPYLLDQGVTPEFLPQDVSDLEKAGLVEIKYVENTGPYRKLLPILKECFDDNCVIVTADDDTIYPPFWLDEMYSTHIKYPNAVIARRATRMSFAGGALLPYAQWIGAPISTSIRREHVNLFLVPTGKDGVLYRPQFFDEGVFDPEMIKAAPTSDDLAFRMLTMQKRIQVKIIGKKLSSSGIRSEYVSINAGEDGLWTNANRDGGNDKNLRSLQDYMATTRNFRLTEFLEE